MNSSHTLALILQHLVAQSQFRSVKEADSLIISLFTLFHKSSVRQAILENASQVVNKRHKKLVCPSATRWLDHERAFSRVIESYEETIIALSTVWTERGDPEAFGILIQMTSHEFILSCLMIVDILNLLKPLVLWLQSSPGNINITDLSRVVSVVVGRIRTLALTTNEQEKKLGKEGVLKLQFNEEKYIDL